jgi:molybdopterin-guanine dinucleotide biosynthesis protein A
MCKQRIDPGSGVREGVPAVLQGTGTIGVVLAGGRGRRMGGDKAGVLLGGRPLAQWVVDALGAVLDDVVIACRIDTELPVLTGVREAWVEPRGTGGPVAAISSALREAHGRTIVACSVSLPLISPATIRALAEAEAAGAAAVIPEIEGRLEGLVGRWEPSALTMLKRLPPDASLESAVHAVAGARLPLASAAADELIRVLAPEDLLSAGAVIDARRVGA